MIGGHLKIYITENWPKTLLDLNPLGAELFDEAVVLIEETSGGNIHTRFHKSRHIGPLALGGVEANDVWNEVL